jgi:UDP-2-acetamido-3-amino-2,3-dideoxy-glucuronate N-acetyltransferase
MSDSPAYVHPLSDVQASDIGAGTRIWQYVVVLQGARIGRDCNICSHCFIESDVQIGDGVTIKSGVQLWNGITLEDGVFVGPNVSFTNDRHPLSGNREFVLERTVVARNASIGAGAVLLPGLRIGVGATVGAGAVVTCDVPDGATVVGNPAGERT